MTMTLEDTIWNFAHDAVKEKFLEFVNSKSDTIQKIIDEELTEDLLREWIHDYIMYSDDYREIVNQIMNPILKKKMLTFLGELK